MAILMRRMLKSPPGVITHGPSLERPVSAVIVPSARIVRASRGSQTILAVLDVDLTALQSAWARSMAAKQGNSRGRTSLLAVALPRGKTPESVAEERAAERTLPDGESPLGRFVSSTTLSRQPGHKHIPPYDSLSEIKVIEAIVGERREWHAFTKAEPGGSATPQAPSLNVTRR